MSEQTVQTSTSFNIKLQDPTMLKEAVNVISEMVEEATFSIDQEGIFFKGMDPSHVCLVDLRSGNQDYEKWEVKQAGNIGLRLDEFSKVLKSLKKKDSLELSFNEDQLNIKSSGMSMNLKTIEQSSTDCPLPKLSYNSKITITGNELHRILKQISNVSNYVTIETYEQRAVFSAKGDNGEVKIEIERGMPEIVEISIREISKATYNLEYLMAFVKHLKGHTLTLDYSENMPLRINAHIGHITQIDYYLAPRIEN